MLGSKVRPLPLLAASLALATLILYSLQPGPGQRSQQISCQCETPRPPPPATGGPSLYPELVAGRVPPDGSYVGASSCNQYTDSLGSGQRVLSYSYYTPGLIVGETEGDLRDRHWFRYLGLVEQLLQDLASLYPGWRMRIYHNVTSAQADQASYLCGLACSHPSLDLCDVRSLPSLVQHQDLEHKVDLGRWWRFLVLGDPTVRMFGIRDLDMFMLERERAAVSAWEAGAEQFYVMRDTPQARNRAGILMPIKGGCWGADNYQDFSLARQLRISEASTRRLVKPRVWRVYRKYDYFAEFFDMVWLRHQLWPALQNRSMIFDSYNCMRHRELGVGVAWPTQRQGHYYVGSGPTKGKVIKRLRSKVCPVQCRPEEHKDWKYC